MWEYIWQYDWLVLRRVMYKGQRFCMLKQCPSAARHPANDTISAQNFYNLVGEVGFFASNTGCFCHVYYWDTDRLNFVRDWNPSVVVVPVQDMLLAMRTSEASKIKAPVIGSTDQGFEWFSKQTWNETADDKDSEERRAFLPYQAERLHDFLKEHQDFYSWDISAGS